MNQLESKNISSQNICNCTIIAFAANKVAIEYVCTTHLKVKDGIEHYFQGIEHYFQPALLTQVTRVGVVNAVYEARAIPGDHKQKEEDGGVSSFGGGGGPAF